MKGKLVFLFALVMLVCVATAYAHHSFAATYDESKTITLEGRMVQFSFRNPHSFVQVEVTHWKSINTSAFIGTDL